MKKILLATTAIAGFAMFATPAIADGLQLEVGGFYRGYGVFTDNDEAAGTSVRDFDFRDDAEIHFSGETTLDNGLTVGAHAEIEIAENSTSNTADEAYAYFSGSWGRVNFGHEDGSHYLLQVAAPSADSNVDGLRTRFESMDFADVIANIDAFEGGTTISGALGATDYDMAMSRDSMKLTYLTPKFSGFQGGVTFAPEVTDGVAGIGNGTATATTDDDAGEFENLWEVAARWDGEFEGVGLSFGAGYGKASTEADGAATTVGSDDRTQWNVAASANMAGFTLGGSFSEDDFGLGGATSGDGQETWVIGAGWDNGPYHVGVSYLDTNFEYGDATGEEVDIDRLTFGGTYAYGPGMTFRGAVSFGTIENDDTGVAAVDRDFTMVTLGTEVSF